ncbi:MULTISPECIES: filamentous hemagglutinin N-terminal domain-containing protein [unclassified Moorena]|uniref:two-partner secretion domain-containing protein n=1 Tax=unclassified Moorena TaxID=2683338 RepID=UPI001400AB5D|nr:MULTISPECIES: filamentous hemagglutinin N-terminal domain-containing protein [unclassified Moorena]NEO11652.1 filamentous hemagglutinin N-terminal domain-containing protein [Moorena sp. SIO3E8]NEQ01199.1 filamentous hemagglutinin N-terminal domain-containing protein [Moorena sp. SIO3F7]
MALDVLKRYNTQFGLALCLAISGAIAFSVNQANAQITPDATLPQGETSQLDLGSGEVNGKIVDLIKGGAIRDINLFHSFLEFNIDKGQRVYFANPAGIQNILSRVTGANPSNILGTLGVDGGANLFLINPNGIFFGDKAKLDVSGSFVGTTADGIGFGNRGVFSASNPEPPSPLLTVNPNVFFFNQIPGKITSQAKLEKLAVDNLLLLGGDIEVSKKDSKKDSKISTDQGGNILLAGLGAPGEVALTQEGDKLGLDFPDGVKKGNVVIKNSAIETLVAKDSDVDGGDIEIIADSLEVENTENKKDRGIFTKSERNGKKSGDISISADNSVLIKSSAEKERQGIFTITDKKGGEGGKITIDAGSLTVTVESEKKKQRKKEQGIFTINKADGQKSGDISITADDSVSIKSTVEKERHGIFTITEKKGGEGGKITIDASSLTVETVNEDQGIFTITKGSQKGGDIIITADGSVSIIASSDKKKQQGIFTLTDYKKDQKKDDPDGQPGGSIQITAGSLMVESEKEKAGISATTSGDSDSGSITIDVTGDVELKKEGTIKTAQGNNKKRQGGPGDVTLNVDGDVTLYDKSRLQIENKGDGSGGKITILAGGAVNVIFNSRIENTAEARDPEIRQKSREPRSGGILIEAASLSIDAREDPSDPKSKRAQNGGIRAKAEDSPIPDGNPIDIRVGSLTMIGSDSNKNTKDAGITANTSGDGKGGRLTIIVEGDFIMKDRAKIEASAKDNRTGNGGEITIEAASVSLSGRSFIRVDARNQTKGNPGNITITANDNIEINNSDIRSDIDFNTGNPERAKENSGTFGNIAITARSLSLKDGGILETSTKGNIPAGNIKVNATDFVEISGVKRPSRIVTESRLGAQAVGDSKPKGGTIEVTTDGKLTVSNGSFISARSIGEFTGGDITINAKEVEVTQGGEILSTATSSDLEEVLGVAAEGKLQTTPLLDDKGAQRTGKPGNAGSITINASEQVIVSGSDPKSSKSTVARIQERLKRQNKDVDGRNQRLQKKLEKENNKLLKRQDELKQLKDKLKDNLSEKDIEKVKRDIEKKEKDIEKRQQDIENEIDKRQRQNRENKIEASNDILVIQDDIPQSRISVGATRGSDAGGLTIKTKNLTVEDGGRISVSAVRLNQDGFPDPELDENGEVDQSKLGEAGKLTIEADSLTLDNGQLVAATGKSTDPQTDNQEAANIDINVSGLTTLDNNSLILADATGDGVTGGNITIDGGLLILFPSDGETGNDIFANAEEGQGGKIEIKLQGLFGNFRLQEGQTRFNDISAISFTGGSSFDGSVQIDAAVNPTQDPEILPTSLVDPSVLIVANCPRSGKVAVDELGEFIVTGRGGLPPSPLDPITQRSVLVDWITLDTEEENIEETTSTPTPDVSYLPMRGKRRVASTPTPARPKKKIVEAQGWTVGEDGTIILTAEPNNGTPKSNWYSPRSCGSKG